MDPPVRLHERRHARLRRARYSMKLRLGQLNQASARRASKLGAELNLLSGLNRLISGYFSGGLSLVVWARIFRMRLARRSRRRRTAWSGTLRRYISRTCRAAVNEAICPLGSVAAAVLTLLFKLISQLASIPALGALQMYFLPAASLPLYLRQAYRSRSGWWVVPRGTSHWMTSWQDIPKSAPLFSVRTVGSR